MVLLVGSPNTGVDSRKRPSDECWSYSSFRASLRGGTKLTGQSTGMRVTGVSAMHRGVSYGGPVDSPNKQKKEERR